MAEHGFDGIQSPVADAGGKRSNALSNRLTTVLSSSYADPESRNALLLLDQRGVGNDEELRRQLKSDAQAEIIASNVRIVDDFGQVAEQLKRVGQLIKKLNHTCDDIRKHVLMAKQESAPVLDEAATLIARQKETHSKQQLLAAFKEHFIVSDEDLALLTSSAEPVDDHYFSVLNRVKQIHMDCEILLGYENQRLGLELMQQTARNLDAGFKKLYTWVQREFKILDLEDPHISGSIRRALRVLSERPTLFQNCLDLFAEARQTTLADAFQQALSGSNNDTTKAIDFSTHDPLRYVGDILAWIHSAAVSERESLEGLFISDAPEISHSLASNEAWADPNTMSEIFDGPRALNSLVSRSLSAVCQSLNSRVHHTTRSIGDPILIYKIYNLLTFYLSMFVKLFDSSAAPATSPNEQSARDDSQNILFTTLFSLSQSTLSHFTSTIEDDLSSLLSLTAPPTPSLSPPPYLTTTLSQFTQILTIRSTNLSSTEFTHLFETLLAPVLNACAESASSISNPQRATIYRLNYICLIHSGLSDVAESLQEVAPLQSLTSAIEKADREITALRSSLVDELTASWLDASGLSDLLAALGALHRQTQNADEEKHSTRSQHQAMLDKMNLDVAAAKLDEFLSSGIADAEEQLSTMQDKALAKSTIAQGVERFVETFEEVKESMGGFDAKILEDRDPELDEEEDIRLFADAWPRTIAEVKALLS